MRRIHAVYSRRMLAASSRSPKWAGCITGTNAERPDKDSSTLRERTDTGRPPRALPDVQSTLDVLVLPFGGRLPKRRASTRIAYSPLSTLPPAMQTRARRQLSRQVDGHAL